MTDEEFYDAEIAPVLLNLVKQCEARGLGMVAMVQYDRDGSVGRTAALPDGSPAVLRYANALGAAQTGRGGVNIDGFMFAVMREAREAGHSSIVLKQLGVPLQPAA